MQALTCPACKAKITLGPDDYQCPQCGDKIRESPEELQTKIALEQSAHTVRRARLWLLIAALLSLASTVFMALAVADRWSLVPDVVKLGIYLGAAYSGLLLLLWVVAPSAPLPATVAALLLYGGVHLAAAIMDPASLLTAGALLWLFRGLVLFSLATGVSAAWKHRKLRAKVPVAAG